MISSSSTRQAAVAALGLIGLVALLLWLYRPRQLHEPYVHYAAEQWRTIRSGNLLERESRRILWASALDCGRVLLGGPHAEVNKCVANAWAGKRAFKASWQILAVDAIVEDGLLGTADGRLFQFQYLEGPYVPNWRSVRIFECPKPITLKMASTNDSPYCY